MGQLKDHHFSPTVVEGRTEWTHPGYVFTFSPSVNVYACIGGAAVTAWTQKKIKCVPRSERVNKSEHNVHNAYVTKGEGKTRLALTCANGSQNLESRL